ncbi:GDSL-type esterase/lipase family protein [Saccharothrix xinjiangensis]|uniref:GDSL-type esterase/lipase family protein n=1 Tax=Saccharothrix xinjiangensis TaxID=204798 RepID=A0ABV9YD94_9PSEU
MARARYWLLGALAGVASVVGAAVFLEVIGAPGRLGPPGAGPLTVVSLGDSTLSGEGAGDYVPETDGTRGNWCHRSVNAAVNRIDVPGVEAKVNLACSGASTEDVVLGGTMQWTESSQARRLADLARTHRVAAVLVAVGANDDPRFSRLMTDCLNARMRLGTPCHDAVARDWRQRLDAVVPKVERVLDDIRRVLTDAGYHDSDYQLVQFSYASPLAPGIPEELRNLSGCPFLTEDLAWIRDHAVPDLAAALREAADRAGARFLDLSRSGHGHEACTGGAGQEDEWFTRLTLDWDGFSDAERAEHASVESFHPNAEGHRQVAGCVGLFLGTVEREAACVPGEDGSLHLTTDVDGGARRAAEAGHPR